MEKKDIKSYTLEELTAELASVGEKSFRASQIYDWIHAKLVEGFEDMSNLPKQLIQKLEAQYTFTRLELVDVQISALDGTRKYLFRLADGNMIESVWMKYHHGNSVCISSQAGCRMGCKFCASTLGGLERSLEPSEMLEQIYRIQKHSGERVSNIVIMGTGEPMDNYENVVRFLHLISSEKGLNISQRNITVSTCGIVPAIRRFANEGLSVTLALSLHASSQEKRKQMMPIANKYELSEVLDACWYYFEKTGRRISFEYSLAAGVNDSKEDAQGLIRLLKGHNCHINLIPINPVRERQFVQSQKAVIENFKSRLEQAGLNATIRREMGRDIDGACGQLRKRYMDKNKVAEEEKAMI